MLPVPAFLGLPSRKFHSGASTNTPCKSNYRRATANGICARKSERSTATYETSGWLPVPLLQPQEGHPRQSPMTLPPLSSPPLPKPPHPHLVTLLDSYLVKPPLFSPAMDSPTPALILRFELRLSNFSFDQPSSPIHTLTNQSRSSYLHRWILYGDDTWDPPEPPVPPDPPDPQLQKRETTHRRHPRFDLHCHNPDLSTEYSASVVSSYFCYRHRLPLEMIFYCKSSLLTLCGKLYLHHTSMTLHCIFRAAHSYSSSLLPEHDPPLPLLLPRHETILISIPAILSIGSTPPFTKASTSGTSLDLHRNSSPPAKNNRYGNLRVQATSTVESTPVDVYTRDSRPNHDLSAPSPQSLEVKHVTSSSIDDSPCLTGKFPTVDREPSKSSDDNSRFCSHLFLGPDPIESKMFLGQNAYLMDVCLCMGFQRPKSNNVQSFISSNKETWASSPLTVHSHLFYRSSSPPATPHRYGNQRAIAKPADVLIPAGSGYTTEQQGSPSCLVYSSFATTAQQAASQARPSHLVYEQSETFPEVFPISSYTRNCLLSAFIFLSRCFKSFMLFCYVTSKHVTPR